MYLEHYNLLEKPFEMSPGPRFLWLGEKHLEALATLKYGIIENKGFLLLTGDVGLGKTALIHRLISEIDASKEIAYLPNPGLEFIDFFNILSMELGMDQKFTSKGAFLIQFKKFLYEKQAENKKVLLIIDEAQRLYHELLEEIRLLSNIELENQKLINIFFVGQTEFNHILLEPRNRALRQRIAVRYQVEPLSREETAHYILHRLKIAGSPYQIFNSNAISEIFRFSKGCPRLINIMCDHALLTGYTNGLKIIHSNVIYECVPELKIPEDFGHEKTSPEPSGEFNIPQIDPSSAIETVQIEHFGSPNRKYSYRKHPILIGLLGILIGFMSYYFLWPKTHSSMQPSPLNELAKPLDEKSEYLLEEDSTAYETRLEEQLLGSEETDSSIRGNEHVQDTPEIKEPEIATELPAIKNPEIVAQNTFIQEKNNDGVINNNTPYKISGEENNSDSLSIQPVEVLNPIKEESQANNIATDSVETEKSIDIPIDEQRTGISKDQQAEAVLISKNESSALKQESVDREKSKEKNSEENSFTDSSTTKNTIAKEKSLSQPESDQLKNLSTSSPLNTSKSTITRSQKPEKPTIKNVNKDEEDKYKAVVTQNKTSDIENKEPVAVAKNTIEEPANKISIAKRDPTIEIAPKSERLEDRIRSFLKHYCNTYASKELGNFARLFDPDAKENGKLFSTLLPKYQRNFNAIEQIEYRIDLINFDYEENVDTVKIEGKFLLKWRPYGQTWRENSGKIFMDLDEKGESFIVQRLDYYGDRRK